MYARSLRARIGTEQWAMRVEYVERINEIVVALCSMFMDTAILIIFSSFFYSLCSFVVCALSTYTPSPNAFEFLCCWIESWTASVREFSWDAIPKWKKKFYCSIESSRKFGNDTNDVYTHTHIHARHVFCCVVHKENEFNRFGCQSYELFQITYCLLVHIGWTNDNFYFFVVVCKKGSIRMIYLPKK